MILDFSASLAHLEHFVVVVVFHGQGHVLRKISNSSDTFSLLIQQPTS